jgi:uncharacterized protein with NRDE domain
MCLIAWRWHPDQSDALVLLSNRDEFYDRPTEAAKQWPGSQIWAGKDQRAGGTWLGVTNTGRFAAITNYRTPEPARATAASRGQLVSHFLASDLPSYAFMAGLTDTFCDYNPFNLTVYDGTTLLGFEGRVSTHRVVHLEPGFGGVSNAAFNTPWFKQTRLQTDLEKLLTSTACADDALLDLLLNDEVAPLHQLPQTGIPLDRELALSAPFVRMGHYGTRASSLVSIRRDLVEFTERGFDMDVMTHQTRHVLAKA